MSWRGHMMAVALLAIVGCSENKEPPAPSEAVPNPITESEAERGAKSCTAYAEKVCECAEADAQYASACELAQGKIEALELAVRVTRSKMTPSDTGAALHNARLMMKTCFEDLATLTSRGCEAIPELGVPEAR